MGESDVTDTAYVPGLAADARAWREPAGSAHDRPVGEAVDTPVGGRLVAPRVAPDQGPATGPVPAARLRTAASTTDPAPRAAALPLAAAALVVAALAGVALGVGPLRPSSQDLGDAPGAQRPVAAAGTGTSTAPGDTAALPDPLVDAREATATDGETAPPAEVVAPVPSPLDLPAPAATAASAPTPAAPADVLATGVPTAGPTAAATPAPPAQDGSGGQPVAGSPTPSPGSTAPTRAAVRSPGPGSDTLQLAEADNGTTAALRPGQRLVLVLGAGRWGDPALTEPSVLQLDEATRDDDGAVTLRFTVLAAGRTQVWVATEPPCGGAPECGEQRRVVVVPVEAAGSDS